MFSAIILAAGESSRFGSPKQLFPVNHKPLILHAIDAFKRVDETIVVLGANRELIAPIIPKNIKIAINEQYQAGQTSSIQCGLKKTSADSAGIFILPVDCALISAQTAETLIAQFEKQKTIIVYLHIRP